MLIFLKARKRGGKGASNMPGKTAAARQERVKKTGARPQTPGLFTINEEDEQQKKRRRRRKAKAPDGLHGKSPEKKVALSRPGKDHALSKSEPHLILKVEERQRLARERREEQEKLMAARESLLLEKEKKARQHYEKQMEERRKKLEEQRMKEERRRAAVDEKRRQKLEEEKERHEAVVRRTMERSQKPKQKNNRWSWGGGLHNSASISSSDPDRRAISTMNLAKHIDPAISKRLSTSSATLLNSPDRGRQPQLSSWESNVVSRLLIPTHSYLARSKSTAALSGDAVIPICPRSASCSPISPQTPKAPGNKSSERPRSFFTTPESVARRKTTNAGFSSGKKNEKLENERRITLTPTSVLKSAMSPSIPRTKSPASLPKRHHKSLVNLSSSVKPTSSPSPSSKEVTTPQRPPSPGNVRPIKRDIKKRTEEKPSEVMVKECTEAENPIPVDVEIAKEERPRTPSPVTMETVQDPPALASTPVIPSPSVAAKPFAGTNNPEEATRILAEKRRLAREQREREEQEKREKEEEERKKKEELALRKAEERARREEEARQQEEERKQKEELERLEKERLLMLQAEEKEQKEREEAERLQKQKEEADRIRLEREKHFQKEEQERSERKKRLEEIMKRTRRSEAVDKQPNVHRNGEIPKTEHTAITPPSLPEGQDSGYLPGTVETPRNNGSITSLPRIITFQQESDISSSEKQPNENGLCSPNNNFEEIINLPVGTKPLKRDALNNEGNRMEDLPLNPMIAFEVDNVQTPQTAEVI